METRSPFYVLIRDTRRSSRLQCKGSTFVSKTLSIGPTPGIELVTFRSAVKRSTDWANPAAVTRFGFHSLKRRRNLTPVSNVCKAAVRSFFWTPTGFKELPKVCFELPFNMIGELAMASLTGQSWRVLKSWYGRPRRKNLGAVSQTFLAGVWLRYVCNAGYVFIAGTLFGAVVHHSQTEFAKTSRKITVADKHWVPFGGTKAR